MISVDYEVKNLIQVGHNIRGKKFRVFQAFSEPSTQRDPE